MDQLQELATWLDAQVPPGRWHDRIYSYCERAGDGSFWAEPLNAWSNGAFHLAALMAFVIWLTAPPTGPDEEFSNLMIANGDPGARRPGANADPSERGQRVRAKKPGRGLVELFLIALVFVIGTGSFLFHTLANRWSAIADVAPIGIFMLLYIAYALKRFVGFGWGLTLIGLGAFSIALWQVGQMRCGPTLCLGGSVAYLPALATLLAVGVVLALKRHPAWASILGGGMIFAVSLTLRTFDKTWCEHTAFGDYGEVGTHLWWHLLNALLLFVLLRAAILHGRPVTPSQGGDCTAPLSSA
ncbi:MAG: hypothetical protein KJ587_07200 [Alphaproteobacteria bacterium]|nr:hypothetical protein [Alphaproteobacteria bacterium]